MMMILLMMILMMTEKIKLVGVLENKKQQRPIRKVRMS